MNKFITVMIIVEGKTEETFVNLILKPYLANKNIFVYATQVTTPGQKGGDVRFSRVKKDIEHHLKQRTDIYVTTFIDYYGIKEWPGIENVNSSFSPEQIAKVINDATKQEIAELFLKERGEKRFIPYIAIHEFEALLFSKPSAIAEELEISEDIILNNIENKTPESINNSYQTAPSKRLNKFLRNKKYSKVRNGIAIAQKIGIDSMRSKCPVFDNWLKAFEEIQNKEL